MMNGTHMPELDVSVKTETISPWTMGLLLERACALIEHASAPDYGGADWIKEAVRFRADYEDVLRVAASMASVHGVQPVQVVRPPE